MPDNHRFFIPLTAGAPAIALRVTPDSDAGPLLRLLGIASPRPAVFIYGGAQGMDAATMARLEPLITGALVPLIQTRIGAIVDGGTQAGIMQMIGAARRRLRLTFPLVGVAPWSLVRYPGGGNQHGVPLEPNHSHFILTTDTEFGGESAMIARVAFAVAGEGSRAAVCLVINGGDLTREDIYKLALANERRAPILVLAGSGRFADALAADIVRGHSDDPMMRLMLQRLPLHVVTVDAGAAGLRAVLAAHFDSRP